MMYYTEAQYFAVINERDRLERALAAARACIEELEQECNCAQMNLIETQEILGERIEELKSRLPEAAE